MISKVRETIQQIPSWVFIVQLFIGLGWLRAGVEKMISIDWWTGEYLRDFVAESAPLTLGWYEPFLDWVVLPAAPLVAAFVMFSQFAIAFGLLTNKRVGAALGLGMFLNLHFIAAGAVTPSAFYLLSQGALALWLAERSTKRETRHALEATAVSGAALAIAHVPWIETLEPAEVIHDPAIMLATAGGIAALGCGLARERIRAGVAKAEVVRSEPAVRPESVVF